MIEALRLPDTRWGAFAGHLLISVVIFVVLYLLIALLFFPGALFQVAGGVEGIRIIAGVDVVLGPLLTLVIYNIAKPRRELFRDLAIIATIQIGALAAGMTVVYKSRPVAVVWVYDAFLTVKAGELAAAGASFEADPLRPVLRYLDLPDDDAEARTVLGASELAGEPMRLRADLYLPLPTQATQLDKVWRGRGQRDSDEWPDCIRHDIVTAFDATQICFHEDSGRFSK